MEKKFKFAYSGSFDPWTKGHLSVLLSFLERDLDANVEIIIATNPQKAGMFTLEERKFIIQKSIPNKFLDRIQVTIVEGVLADYLYERNIPYIIKGIRDEADYRYETNLASLNSQFYGSPMTLLIPQVNFDLSLVSSSNLKMLTNLGISLDRYANAFVREIIKLKTSKKLLIGVTGGITSGKSTFCLRLQAYAQNEKVAIHYINMDQMGYNVLNSKSDILPLYRKIRKQIADEFGPQVLNDDGTINRRELGHIVFSDQSRLDRLTNIMLEPLLYLLGQKINSLDPGIVLIESTILFDRHLTELMDENIIFIYLDPAMQKQRMQEARHHSQEQAQKRIDSQISFRQVKDSIAAIQEDQYDRLFLEYPGDIPLTDSHIAKIYQNLAGEYYFRQEVRRDRYIFIPAELAFQEDTNFFEMIITEYSTPGRSYHNLIHIKELLLKYIQIKSMLQHPIEVYLAIMFHDIRYDPKVSNNEEISASMAIEYLKQYLSKANIQLELVSDLILLTAHHDQELWDIDCDAKLFLDMDMAIFAASEDRLLEYEHQIYQEYSAIATPAEYRKGRLAFLQKLLEKKNIYRSVYFRSHYETQARTNIQLLCKFVEHNPSYGGS